MASVNQEFLKKYGEETQQTLETTDHIEHLIYFSCVQRVL